LCRHIGFMRSTLLTFAFAEHKRWAWEREEQGEKKNYPPEISHFKTRGWRRPRNNQHRRLIGRHVSNGYLLRWQ
jgi:hypothetical protein